MTGHNHGGATATGAQRGRLSVVLAITLTLFFLEVLGGLLAHSLVLFADAAHMAADSAGVGLSLLAVLWAARPASSKRTFGYQRAEILAAVFNAVLLFGLGAFIVVEAIRRMVNPGSAQPGIMAVFGVLALFGNGVSLSLLARGQGKSLNVRGAYLEVLSDLLGAAAVLIAAAVIAFTGFQRADPLASLFTSFRVADACAVSPTPSAGMTVTVMLASWGAVNSPKQADSSASPNACTSIRPRPGKLSGSFMISPTFYSNGRPMWSDGANESTEDTMNCMRPPTESLCLHQLIDTAAFIDSCHSRCRTGSQFARNFSRPDSGAYDRSELVVSLGFSRR